MDERKINTWLNNDENQIGYYTSSYDVILIERKRCIKLLADIISYHFPIKENLNILDLGCGDGIITSYLYKQFPQNNYFLLDGSSEMLDKAKERLNIGNISFINQSFEDYIKQICKECEYDFVFSSNAIHHLDYFKKNELYNKIFKELKYDGMFINIDVVLPNSNESEKLQFKMWSNWVNETITNYNLTEQIGKHDELPKRYKSSPENKPSKLVDQLDMLQKIGFRDVDCFFKYSIFAMFGGVK